MFNNSLRLTAATMDDAVGLDRQQHRCNHTPCCGDGDCRRSAACIGVMVTTDSVVPKSVTTVSVLGHGRAAEARLVQATIATQCSSTESGRQECRDGEHAETTLLCVEKVFQPGLLTRLIYRASFQAPFAYQTNADAILASFYRRRVAASIVRAMIPIARVAVPLYVRWDQQYGAMVLASEFIRGRGIVPAAADRWMIRRRLAALCGRHLRVAAPPAEEIDELLDLMTRLESLLIQCGLTGSGWQVCTRALVSTANLLRTDNGYVLVDLESGIPSVLVPRYVRAGLRLGAIPLFDDLDPEQLRSWVRENRSQLSTALDPTEVVRLDDDVERLIGHTANWKLGELAVGRQPQRLLGSDFRNRFKTRTLQSWQSRRIVDEQSAAFLSQSRRFFTGLTFLLGLIPGKFGRFFQRLWANASYRQQTYRFISNASYRKELSDRFVTAKSEVWRSGGRISPDTSHQSIGISFVANWVLSQTTPALLHRLITDRVYRANRLTQMFLLCVSGTFQSNFGRLLIQSRIQQWRASERLTAEEADLLHRQLRSRAVDEYVRCFGLHVGLKLLFPVVMSLKVGGAAASVASGNPLYFLFMLMLLPMLRTGVTVWRMTASGYPAASYRESLLVGMIPVIGSLAYPVQMYAKFSALSLFLMRDFAARVGCWLPIYGGKDSRTELAAIRSVNVIAEALSLWLATTETARSREEENADDQLSVQRARVSTATPIARWERLAEAQLALLAAELGLTLLQTETAPTAVSGQGTSSDGCSPELPVAVHPARHAA